MEKTLRKIDEIVGKINTHPEYSDRTKRESLEAMRLEAQRHSLKLETEVEKTLTKKEMDAEIQESLRRLENAWNYLCSREDLTVGTIAPLGKIIAPERQKTPGFRQENIRFAHFEDEVPPWTQVIDRVGNFLESLPYLDLHPILKAAGIHVSIVQIHPFMDGNGRCARLLQNFHLVQTGYPPIPIYSTEGDFYRELMTRVVADRYSGKSTIHTPSLDEKLFQKLIISKALAATERLRDELENRRSYSIELSEVDNPAIAISVKRMLSSFGRKRDKTELHHELKSVGRGKHQLELIGDIGQQEIQGVLERARAKYGIRYNIKVNRY